MLKRKVPIKIVKLKFHGDRKEFSVWQLMASVLILVLIGSYLTWRSFGLVCACGGSPPPTTPTSLTVKGVSSNDVVLGWGASTSAIGIAGYNIYETSSSSTTGIQVGKTSSPSTLSYDVTSLKSSTAYGFYVEARDTNGTLSSPSNRVSVTTLSPPPTGSGGGDTTPPTAPANLTATAADDTSTDLSWSPATDNVGVTGYLIIRNSAPIFQTSGTAVSDSGLNPSTTYTYQVKAFDAKGNTGPVSNTAQATTLSSATQPDSSSSDYAGNQADSISSADPQDIGSTAVDNSASATEQPDTAGAPVSQPASQKAIQSAHAERRSPLLWVLPSFIVSLVVVYALLRKVIKKKAVPVAAAPPAAQTTFVQSSQPTDSGNTTFPEQH